MQVSILKFSSGSANPRQYNDAVDEARLSRIEGTVAARNLWADAAATTVGLATGPAITTLNLGTGMGAGDALNIGGAGSLTTVGGNLTVTGNFIVNGTTTTVNSTTLNVVDRFIVAAVGGGGVVSGGFAVEDAGGVGSDFAVMWNETAGRAEIGFADTDTNPASVASFASAKVSDLFLAGTTIVADAALTVTATGGTADLTLGARGTTTTFNQAGNTTLIGFAATSVIGALNELKVGGAPYMNGEGTTLTQGEVVYLDTTDTAKRANAANSGGAFAGNITRAFGFVVPVAGIASAASGQVQSVGVVQVLFIAGLTLIPGDEVFLAKTVGRATNLTTGYVVGDTIRSLGVIKDIQTYTNGGVTEALVEVQVVHGAVLVV